MEEMNKTAAEMNRPQGPKGPQGPQTRLEVEVIGLQGFCRKAHKVGDKFTVSPLDPGGLCGSAFHAAFPMILALSYGGKLPWNPESNEICTVCPDYKNQMSMKITRTIVDPDKPGEENHV